VQSNVLRLLGSVFQRPSVGGCHRICFIVTSRPEPWIRDEFTIEPLFSITRQIFLGQTSEANDDIRTFLRLGFTEIHDSRKHRLRRVSWETGTSCPHTAHPASSNVLGNESLQKSSETVHCRQVGEEME
jgi:hypothetical protein